MTTSATLDHQPHEIHPHDHDRWCGHAAVPHGDHLDYLHDGHVHHLDVDHVDDVAAALDRLHLSHTGHMHVHREGCGHPAIEHLDHLDFQHGEHRHAPHGDHYDEH